MPKAQKLGEIMWKRGVNFVCCGSAYIEFDFAKKYIQDEICRYTCIAMIILNSAQLLK